MQTLCATVQPEQVADELATGVSSTPEWKALSAHRAEIEKTCVPWHYSHFEVSRPPKRDVTLLAQHSTGHARTSHCCCVAPEILQREAPACS